MIGYHNDTCNMTVGQFIPEKEAKCKKIIFSSCGTLYLSRALWHSGVVLCLIKHSALSHALSPLDYTPCTINHVSTPSQH